MLFWRGTVPTGTGRRARVWLAKREVLLMLSAVSEALLEVTVLPVRSKKKWISLGFPTMSGFEVLKIYISLKSILLTCLSNVPARKYRIMKSFVSFSFAGSAANTKAMLFFIAYNTVL